MIFALLLLVRGLCPFAAFAWPATVIGVTDGDTITVLTDLKQQVKVRLYGVDCPESRQAFGNRARQFVSALVFRKRVDVEVMDVDRYGRTVGIVTAPDGKVVNRQLLEAGMAWLYPAYCKASVCGEWKKVEAVARKARRGLWADRSPVPPWVWRKRKK